MFIKKQTLFIIYFIMFLFVVFFVNNLFTKNKKEIENFNISSKYSLYKNAIYSLSSIKSLEQDIVKDEHTNDLNLVEEYNNLDLNSLKLISPKSFSYIKSKDLKKLPTLKELNVISSFYNIPENLLYSLMLKESRGDFTALSHKNAKGLFQFLPETAIQFGLNIDENIDERLNPWKSADASARYISWIFNYLHPELDRLSIDNYTFVLAGYNAGIGNVKKGQSLSIPNYKETIDYVRDIIGHTKGELYVVKRGDTLRKISENFKLSYFKLSIMNKNIDEINLKAGDYLFVKDVNEIQYTVEKGDSLYKIAENYYTTISEIKKYNNINDNILNIGQKMKIPL